MNLSKYILLFHKKQTGQLSEEDAQALEAMRENDAHRGLAEELGKVWSSAGAYKSAYEPDVETAWSRFKPRIEANEPRVASLRPRRRFRLAAAAAVLLLLAGGWWFYAVYSSDSTLAFSTLQNEMQEVALPDGSLVVLNESSYLSYEAVPGRRQVNLSGEAYFDVAPDPSSPFVITANDTRTTVLGTAFNLRAYPEETTVEVEVAEGRVRMEHRSKGDLGIELTPQERGVFSAAHQTLVKMPAPELNAQAWRTQRLIFRDAQLATALEDIERYYGVEFHLQNKALEDCALTTEIREEELSEFLDILEAIYSVEIGKRRSGYYIIQGGRCR